MTKSVPIKTALSKIQDIGERYVCRSRTQTSKENRWHSWYGTRAWERPHDARFPQKKRGLPIGLASQLRKASEQNQSSSDGFTDALFLSVWQTAKKQAIHIPWETIGSHSVNQGKSWRGYRLVHHILKYKSCDGRTAYVHGHTNLTKRHPRGAASGMGWRLLAPMHPCPPHTTPPGRLRSVRTARAAQKQAEAVVSCPAQPKRHSSR